MFDEPSYQDIIRAQRRAVLVKVVLAALVLLLVLAATVHKPLLGHVEGWLHGDHDILGRDLWEPPELPADPGAIDGLDLHLVHAELLPSWFIALANHPAASDRVEHALAELQAGVAADPQLLALVTEAHSLVVVDPWTHGDRLRALTDAWNDHMQALGQPWHLESNVVDMGEGAFFYTKSYRVEADLVVPIEGEDCALRVVRRVDHTNVRESYLGAVVKGQDRALVVVDRLREHALDELWPLLDPGLDPELPTREAAFAPLLRVELASGLAPEHMKVLQATARARWELLTTAESVNERQACGATLAVYEVPWQGFDQTDLDNLESRARAEGHKACSSISLGEVDRIRAATQRLRDTPGLEPALEALVAWIARGTAVHELRHVADARRHGLDTIPCERCEEELSTRATREASAYLASLAWSDARIAALYQACDQSRGHHASAIHWLSAQLGGACDLPSPELVPRARALEQELFGERGAIELPESWPERLPVR